MKQRALIVILALYTALALGYSLATPFGAPPDEKPHAMYVQHLAERRSLPVLRQEQREAYESHQPPLYYLLATPIWWATAGVPEATRAFLLRLLSTLIGGAGLWLIWRLATLLSRPGDVALAIGAVGFTAFLPMRLATVAAVGNDMLAESLFTATLLLLALAIRDGIDRKRAVVLGGILGLGLLTKSTCLLLFPISLLGLVFAERTARGRLVETAATVYGAALVIGGWWLVRNQRLYGEVFVAQTFVLYFQDTPTPELFLRRGLSFADYLSQLVIPLTFRSFWGVFGHMQVYMGVLKEAPFMPPSWLYPLLVIPTGAAAAGLIRVATRDRKRFDRSERAVWGLLGVTALLVVAALLRFNTEFFQAQGRYLFPAMAPISLFAALGIQALAPEKARTGVALGTTVGMLALTLYALIGCILPAF